MSGKTNSASGKLTGAAWVTGRGSDLEQLKVPAG